MKKADSDVWASLAFLIGMIGFVASFGATTQLIARTFGYAPILGRPLFGHFYQPFGAAIWLINLDMRCYVVANLKHTACAPGTLAFLPQAHLYLGIALGITALVVGAFVVFAISMGSNSSPNRGKRLPTVIAEGSLPFTLDLGTSTGKLAKLEHGAAIAAGQSIRLVGDEASQNLVAYGGIGSGKTTRFVNPVVLQALQQDCGMFVCDIKGDYGDTLRELALRANREIETIGLAAKPFNLLAGLTPEVASSFIKSALLLAGNTNAESAIWNEVGTELARNALGVLSFVPEHYTLTGLFNYLFNEAFHKSLEDPVNQVYERLSNEAQDLSNPTHAESENQRVLLQRYADYETNVFDTFDSKVKSGVKFQLSSILSLFTMPEIERTFCAHGSDHIHLEETLDGKVFLLDLPIQKYGLGAKTIYTFMKLRFFSVINQRRVEPTWNQTRSVVFVCDEYQEIVSIARGALSDLNFWDKSRSAKCVGVISAQGIESFRAAIGSNSLTDAFLQNFRQVICFRTEDRATIERMTYLLGQVEVERKNRSRSTSRSSSVTNSSTGHSETSSLNQQLQATINPQLIRTLRVGEALANLSIGGESYDDIIATSPVYANA